MKLFKIILPIFLFNAVILIGGCNNKSQQEEKTVTEKPEQKHDVYTCPMHPQIIRDQPGQCPICGMDLVKKEEEGKKVNDVSLNELLKPSNQYVISTISTVHLQSRDEPVEIEAYGFITYDTRTIAVISSNVSGRIEKLYVKYRFQKINRGDRIMDIYSPELLTAQENLLFIVKNDPGNLQLISAAKQKLLLLGMSNKQLEQVIKSGKTFFTVSVFSNYSGHIHESGLARSMEADEEKMKDVSLITEELRIKEGMYVQKGQNIFSVYDPAKAWAVVNLFSGQSALVKLGDKVRVVPETAPQKDFRAAISFIEPFYRKESKTMTARIYFDNAKLDIPIGSQVKAVIFSGTHSAMWLPEEAVLTLGLDKVVFLKRDNVFIAHKIEPGIIQNHLVQVISGLSEKDEVAANAQYLVDSESFIKVNQ